MKLYQELLYQELGRTIFAILLQQHGEIDVERIANQKAVFVLQQIKDVFCIDLYRDSQIVDRILQIFDENQIDIS